MVDFLQPNLSNLIGQMSPAYLAAGVNAVSAQFQDAPTVLTFGTGTLVPLVVGQGLFTYWTAEPMGAGESVIFDLLYGGLGLEETERTVFVADEFNTPKSGNYTTPVFALPLGIDLCVGATLTRVNTVNKPIMMVGLQIY